MTVRGWPVAVGLLVVVVVMATVAVLATRPRATVTVPSGVSVECSGTAGSQAACGAWARDVLARGPGTRTFYVEDVATLRLQRDLLGFGSGCSADWILGRWDGDPALSEPVPCPGS